MHVRLATLDDVPGVLALVAGYCAADDHVYDEARVRPALEDLIANPSYGQVLVAEHDEHLHGYGVLTWGYGLESGAIEALLDELYVQPQGEGIGALLLDSVIEAARSHGARVMFLETEAPNGGARDFYARHGFELQTSIWMSRRLG